MPSVILLIKVFQNQLLEVGGGLNKGGVGGKSALQLARGKHEHTSWGREGEGGGEGYVKYHHTLIRALSKYALGVGLISWKLSFTGG